MSKVQLNPDDRTTYIGSSDARDILAGDFDKVYSEKAGLKERPNLDDSFPVQLGRITEDFHLDWSIRRLNEETGGAFKWSKTKPDGEQHFAEFRPDVADDVPPILGSHPDALVRDHAGGVYPLEAKITGRFRNADEAADFYMPQLQHHMLCWGVDRILFSVIVGTSEPERIWVGASPEWQEHYIGACTRFWRYIEAGERPAPTFFGDVKKPTVVVPTKIADTVPRNGWKKRSLDGDNKAPALIDEFIITKAQAKRHEEVKKELKDLMREDENELYGSKVTLKRNVKGSILITVHDEKKAA